QLQAEIPRAAHIGDWLDLRSGHVSGLLEGLCAEKLTLQKSLRDRQTNHSRRHAGVSDKRPRDDGAGSLDPDASAKGSDIQVVPLGNLVQFQQLVPRRQRDENTSNDL